MSGTQHDWATLAAGLLRGESAAEEAFARQVGAWLCNFVARWLPAGEDYEQFALDVLTEVVASIGAYAPERGSLPAWVRCIASRRVADFYRLREQRDRQELGKYESAHREKFHLELKPTEAEKQNLLAAVAALAAEDLELLRLFFEEKLPDSEVAKALSISADAARQRKRRLVRRLYGAIKQDPKVSI